ncbi:putative RNA methyltransferase [Alkalihalobacillus trypoxylicola]|uniref:Uncharacterized protein n=1 Tax=Alkalihalobacillus trypoxylicola TaxID=519424 RepID=A0A162CQ82_9BACI|nr:methyltransferase domain-containing protein [Alkalihalobacillus trypoxylicola]KYG25991.1 hypothetical protein AZF04_12955 [Alkalihalobacillus trypoxylicola]
MTKSKKIRSAEAVKKIQSMFSCPYCSTSMTVVNLQSLVCQNRHTFDFAKQGYLNLLRASPNNQYNQKLFLARKEMIIEGQLFAELHKKISEIITNYFQRENHITMLDLGCGEGSHLEMIAKQMIQNVTGIGMDISKEGILQASKSYDDYTWIVGDLTHSPFSNHNLDVVLNILSPSNYLEFSRLLKSEGLLIKVIPRNLYLIELRQFFYNDEDTNTYDNQKTTKRFSEHFNHYETFTITYEKELKPESFSNLVEMTPLTWSVSETKIAQFLQDPPPKITVDFDVLVGYNH